LSVYDGYGRVSRVGKRQGESYISPKEQEKKDRQWAKERGKKFGVFEIDEDVSGATEKRPGLERLIARVEAGISAGIICPKLDRFGRSVEQVLRNYRRVTDAGGVVVFVEEGLDPTTPTGKLLFGVLASLAEFQWLMAREGWADATANAIERGIHISPVPPTGYARGEDGRLVPDPLVAPQITKLFKLIAGGMAKGEAYAVLNDEFGNFHWNARIAYVILRNRVYLGEARYADNVNENAHTPLTDPITFAAAQGNRRVGSGGRSGALLNGLVRCAGCRRVMTVSWQVKEGEEKAWDRHAYYRCNGECGSAGKCEAPSSIKAAFVEGYVLDYFWEYAKDRQLVGSMDTAELEAAVSDLEAAEATRKEFGDNTRLQGLGDAYVDGLASRMAVENAAREVVIAMQADLAHPELGDVSTLDELWIDLGADERRELLCAVVGAVYVKKGRVAVEDRSMIFPRGEEPESPTRGRTDRFPIMPLVFD
jgi:DNA invertase Pin-like site-specific DNA recombinase